MEIIITLFTLAQQFSCWMRPQASIVLSKSLLNMTCLLFTAAGR